MAMSRYEFLGTKQAPIKAWTDGVPVERAALDQLHNLAGLPFVFKHVAAMPDVHLGKAATFRAHDCPVPEGVTQADLARLSALIHRHDPDHLVLLGDLFHAREALHQAALQPLREWRAGCRLALTLVRGNHDRRAGAIPADLSIETVEALHASTRASKEKLAEEKRQAALAERERLAAERERKRQNDAQRAAAKQRYHDDIYEWKVMSAVEL